MGLGRKESSFDHARGAHRTRGDSVDHHRAALANARSVLGSDRDFGCHAIHPWRDAHSVDRADRRDGRRRIDRSNRGKLLRVEFDRVRSGDLLGLLSIGFRLEKTAYR